MSKLAKHFLVVLAGWFSLIFTIAWIYSYSSKHIDFENKWLPVKVALNRDSMGSWAFVSQRQAVFDERLNLGKWFGNNELISRSPFVDKSCWNFELELFPNSIFLITLRQVDKSSIAFMLSRSKLDSSAIIEFDQRGRYLKKTPIGFEGERDLSRIEVCRNQEVINLNLDDRYLAETVIKSSDRRLWIGFGNRTNSVILDNIEQTNSDDKILFKEDFSTGTNFWLVSILSLVISLLHTMLTKNRSWSDQVLTLFVLTFSLLLYGLFDRFIWAKQLPIGSLSSESLSIKLLQKFEAVRDEVFPSKSFENVFSSVQNFMNSEQLLKFEPQSETRTRFSYGSDSAKKKILVIGTSQTWGAGATFEEFSLGKQIFNLIEEYTGQKIYLELLAAPGAIARDLAEIVRSDLLLDKEWDSIVINLSSNDRNELDFRVGLEELILWSKENSRKLYLVKEPNSPEFLNPMLKDRHLIISELAQKYESVAIDTDNNLASQSHFQMGHVWWDFVHLTDWGQFLLAQTIVASLVADD